MKEQSAKNDVAWQAAQMESIFDNFCLIHSSQRLSSLRQAFFFNYIFLRISIQQNHKIQDLESLYNQWFLSKFSVAKIERFFLFFLFLFFKEISHLSNSTSFPRLSSFHTKSTFSLYPEISVFFSWRNSRKSIMAFNSFFVYCRCTSRSFQALCTTYAK